MQVVWLLLVLVLLLWLLVLLALLHLHLLHLLVVRRGRDGVARVKVSVAILPRHEVRVARGEHRRRGGEQASPKGGFQPEAQHAALGGQGREERGGQVVRVSLLLLLLLLLLLVMVEMLLLLVLVLSLIRVARSSR